MCAPGSRSCSKIIRLSRSYASSLRERGPGTGFRLAEAASPASPYTRIRSYKTYTFVNSRIRTACADQERGDRHRSLWAKRGQGVHDDSPRGAAMIFLTNADIQQVL